jgi:hypothetical protein
MTNQHPRFQQTQSANSAQTNGTKTPQKSTVEDLISYIEQHPDYAELVEQAKNPPKHTSRQNKSAKVSQFLLELVIANPENFYGKAMVSQELIQQSKLTAALVSVSSLLNFFTNSPLLFFAFKNMGGWAYLWTVITNGLILYFTNGTATAASARKPGRESWANCAIAAMITMNALQSVVAGIGTELLLNQSGLSELKAKELVEGQVQRVELLKEIDNPQYLDAQQRCKEGEAILNNMQRNNPRWDSLFIQLYGSYAQRNQDWSPVPIEKLPICRKVDRLQTEAYANYEVAKAKLETQLTIRAELGNDVQFLEQEMDVLYNQHFTDDGHIESGVEAARVAIFSFFNKLTNGDLAGLGFPLFFLILSLITSGFACAMTIAHSHRQDTKKSFSDAVERERDRWLEKKRRELMELHRQQNESSLGFMVNENHSTNGHKREISDN